jgi:hypothetical protein
MRHGPAQRSATTRNASWGGSRAVHAPAHHRMPHALDAEAAELLQSVRPMPALLGATTADAPSHCWSRSRCRTTRRIRLASADPAADPVLEHGYLQTAADREGTPGAARLACGLLKSHAWQPESTGLAGLEAGQLCEDGPWATGPRRT